MNILLTAILLTNILFLMVILAAFVWLRALYAHAEAVLRDFFVPEPETLSKAGVLWQSLSTTLGQQVAMQIKTTIMGMSSGAARAEKAVNESIVEDAANQANPLIGGLLSGFPSLKKKLAGNPSLAGFVLNQLANMKAKAPEDNHASQGTTGGFASRAKL